MSIAKVKEFMKTRGRENDVLEFSVSSATVDLAAEALGCKPAHIAKTVSLYDKDGTGAVIVVTAGDRKIDNGKFKRLFGFKPHMIAWEDVEKLTGHAPGGVCPFVNPDGVKSTATYRLKITTTFTPRAARPTRRSALLPTKFTKLSDSSGWVDVTNPANNHENGVAARTSANLKVDGKSVSETGRGACGVSRRGIGRRTRLRRIPCRKNRQNAYI